MKSTVSVLPERWGKYICVLAAMYAAAVLAFIVMETGKPSGSRDFHPFWYAGHFVLQGSDPYAAYLAKEQPKLPIQYIDGVTINQYPVAQKNLSPIPTNTPVMQLFLALFSFFSWNVAKWLFFFFNLTLTLITGWLVIKWMPFAGIQLTRLDGILLFLLYFDFSATRIAIENGQTTLLVFWMMLLALLYVERSWPLAGSALGMALSKYSLSLPVFLFLFYKKKYKALLLALAIQGLGLFGLSALSGNSPVLVIRENLQILGEVFGQPGVHLSHFFELFTDNGLLTQIPVLIMSLLVFAPLFFWLRNRNDLPGSLQEVIDLHVITVLFIWTMLVAYHRLYDTIILIIFYVLVFKGLAFPNIWKLTNGGRLALLLFMAITPLILILPARLVDEILPDYYGSTSDAVTTVFLLVMLTISMLLLRRLLQFLRTETISQRAEIHDIPIDTYRETQPVGTDHS